MTWRVAVLVMGSLLPLSASARAAAPDAERVHILVRQLDSDDFSERVAADRSLRDLGVPAIPLLRAALAKKPSVEVERRLEAIIRDLGRLTWHHDLNAALREAKKTGKPLLVFSTLGIDNGFGSVAARAMQRDTFADARVHERLPRDYVLYWHNRTNPGWEAWFLELHAQQFPGQSLDTFVKTRLQGYAEGRGGASVVTFFCTPEGRIVYPLPGYWGPERYLQEAAAASKLVRDENSEPARYRVASRLERLVFPEPMDKGLAAPCKQLLIVPLSSQGWHELLRPNYLPIIDEPIATVMVKLEKQTALTH
jgi:hypothetical protein